MKKLRLILMMATTTSVAFGQNYVDLANVNYSISPSSGDTNVSFEKKGVHLQLPIVMNSLNVVIAGVGTSTTSVSTPDASFNQSFHNVVGLLGYQRKLKSNWTWLGMSIHQINAGRENVSMKYYQPGFFTTVTYKQSNNLKYKFGAVYKSEFSGPFVLPLFGVDWQVNDKLQVFGLLPISANVIYKPGNKFGYGLTFKGAIATYGVETGDTPTYVQENNNQLHFSLDYYITDEFVLQGKAGYRFDNKYREFSTHDKVDLSMGPAVFGDEREAVSSANGDGLSFRVSLIYRYSLVDKP